MKNDTVNEKDKQAEERIVMADECGDSMWDEVLGQEVKASQITKTIPNPDTLINIIEREQLIENEMSNR